MAVVSAAAGAGFVAASPLGAPNPGPTPDPSPYYPSTRRFGNPLLHLKNLHARLDKPGLEPADFIPNLGWRNLITHHLIKIFADNMNSAESDSG